MDHGGVVMVRQSAGGMEEWRVYRRSFENRSNTQRTFNGHLSKTDRTSIEHRTSVGHQSNGEGTEVCRWCGGVLRALRSAEGMEKWRGYRKSIENMQNVQRTSNV